MESSPGTCPEQGLSDLSSSIQKAEQIVKLFRCGRKKVEALTRIAQAHHLFTCLCKLWYVYLVTIPHLSYNVSNMKLCPATQYAIIIALTSNEAETLNSLLQGIK